MEWTNTSKVTTYSYKLGENGFASITLDEDGIIVKVSIINLETGDDIFNVVKDGFTSVEKAHEWLSIITNLQVYIQD